MPERFDWVDDPTRGEWLRSMEAEPFGSVLSVVPRGFEGYARVFHPVERDRPRETKTWKGIDPETYFEGTGDIDAALETERVSWSHAAASFGTTMHAEAQYAPLLRRSYGNVHEAIAADGWRYFEAGEGSLDVEALSVASSVLARHTNTPDAGIAAIWDGWGGLMSSDGVAHLTFESADPWSARDVEPAVAPIAGGPLSRRVASFMQGIGDARSRMGALRALTREEAEPGSGLLSREVAEGPRFGLHADTGRSYVLFQAGASDFADPSWRHHAPWVEESNWTQSPSILWPEDHSWVLATEIDFDSTLVAGSAALIDELVQTPGLEVLTIGTDAALSWDGDVINRPQ